MAPRPPLRLRSVRRRGGAWAIGVAVAVALSVACGLLVLPAAGNARMSRASFDIAAAARVCAPGRSITARLGPSDLAFLRRYVPCFLRRERAAYGRSFVSSARLSSMLTAEVDRFIAAGSTGVRREDAGIRTFELATGRAVCGRRAFDYNGAFDDSRAPGPITALAFGRNVADDNRTPLTYFERRSTRFGTTAVRGLLYRRHDLSGVTAAYISIACLG